MAKIKDYLLILILTVFALIIGLMETIAGKTFEDDWLDIHVYSNENHGQGPMKGMDTIKNINNKG